jgi:hypothetical protein
VGIAGVGDGPGSDVAVGGIGVGVVGTAVAVGGTDVGVGVWGVGMICTVGVGVWGVGMIWIVGDGVGGTGVAVGGTAVAVGVGCTKTAADDAAMVAGTLRIAARKSPATPRAKRGNQFCAFIAAPRQ